MGLGIFKEAPMIAFQIRCAPILAALFILLAGCAGETSPTSFVANAPTDAFGAQNQPAEYHISPGDLLAVNVFQVPDLTKEVQVDANGIIALPLIGEIHAGGQTTHGLETEIATKLRAKYLQSPQVSVFLRNAVGAQVTITGAVNRPGVYPIAGQMSLGQALALSGDVAEIGDPTSIRVFRHSDGGKSVAKFNLDDIRAGKSPDPALEAGDMVVVDNSGARVAWKNTKDILMPTVQTAATPAAFLLK